ncbi:MAG: hypothetical protein AMXMBFR13_35590 [Phycisphaerae bacterium]
MRMHFLIAGFLVLSGAGRAVGLQSGDVGVTLTLREPLDRDWAPSWVSFSVELPAGQIKGNYPRVVNAEGKPVDASLSIEDRHEDGTAKQGTVWVYTPLGRNETKTFRVLPDEPSGSSPRGKRRPAHFPVFRSPADPHRSARLSNGLISVLAAHDSQSLAGPAAFYPPSTIDVWPIRAVYRRQTPLLVKSRSTKIGKVQTFEAKLLPAPPHELLYEIRYGLIDGKEYVCRLRLIAHEPVVLIEEEFRGISAEGWLLDSGEGLNPTRAQGRFHRPTGLKLKREGDSYPLDPAVADGCLLQPFYAWWPDYSIWWGAFRPDADYVGIFTTQPREWLHPAPNRIQIRTGPEHGVQAYLPLQNGTRRWGILVADESQAREVSPAGGNLIQRMMIRLSENPLDRVKELPLRWPGCEQIEYPHLLCRPADLPVIREKARTYAPLARVLQHYPEAPEDPSGLYLATGEETHARSAIDGLKEQLRGWVEEALSGDGYLCGDLVAIPFTRPLRQATIIFDSVAGSASMTPDERDWCLRAFAFLAHVLADENRWPPRNQGFHRGNVNFHSDDYTCLAAVAALLPGHPDQQKWMDYVEREMRLEFDKCVSPGGAWCEAPNYQGFTMHYLMIAMRMMQLNGFGQFVSEPRFRATMDYMFRTQTPWDVRSGIHMLPTVGDTTAHYHSQSLQNVFAWAAALFQDDPALAGRMMHAWRRGGSMLFGAHGLGPGAGWTQPLLLVDPSLPEVAPDQPLESERLAGYGALLRNNYGTPRETYFLFKMGPIDQHFDSDEGSFHWYALGMPLSMDFGCMYVPSIEQPWLHNTLDFDRQRIWTQGDITDFASFPALDYCAGRLCAKHFQRIPDEPETGPPGSIRGRAPCVDWRRQVLFVKGPDYVVLRDDVEDADNQMKTGWHLQVLASGSAVEGQQAHFTGPHGVDLAVLVAWPPDAKLTTSAWGYEGKPAPEWVASKLMPPMSERQVALHAEAAPSGDYLTVMAPYVRGRPTPKLEQAGEGMVRVVHEEGDDLVVFAREPVKLSGQDWSFDGRVGLIRRSAADTMMFIAEGSEIRSGEWTLSSVGPMLIRTSGDRIQGFSDGAERTVTLRWKQPRRLGTITGSPPAKILESDERSCRIKLPAGACRFELTSE